MMLMGEHAVLYNYPALVFAINKRIQASLTLRKDNQIFIQSHLGDFKTDISKLFTLKIEKPFHFVLETILYFHRELPLGLPQGFELSIECPGELGERLEDTLGFGSSAAVTVAVTKVMLAFLGIEEVEDISFFQIARSIVKKTQGGVGSGADVAASVFGGLINYQVEPLILQKIKIPVKLPLVAIYSGHKTPTVEVIRIVEKNQEQEPDIYKNFYSILKSCVEEFSKGVTSLIPDLIALGSLMSHHQQIMTEMHLTTPAIQEILNFLNQDPKIYGAKISGSGLGDCVIGLGEISSPDKLLALKQKFPNIKEYSIQIEEEGVLVNEKHEQTNDC